jgi:hypothetical protein
LDDFIGEQSDEIKNVLWEVCPEECEELGHAIIDDIVAGQTEFATFEHGAHMDLHAVIGILPPIATLIWKIYEKIAEHRKRSSDLRAADTEREIILRVSEADSAVTGETKKRIVEVIVKRRRAANP